MIQRAKTILNDTFGYPSFRPLQQDVIEHILSKQDTLVIMPTGGGKSLCYQIPALLFSGVTVVVSPLISLMKDQVDQLTALGVGAVFLNSSLSPQAYQHNVSQIRQGKAKLVYLAPEALLKGNTLSLLAACRVDCLTIDEAHCISEWGHDFRPEYRQLAQLRKRFSHAVCVALTATATPRVRQDIQKNLNFTASSEFIASFNRQNLFLEVAAKTDPLAQTVEFLKKFPDESGIIYCLSRRQVDELSQQLTREGFSVCPYHAGLGDVVRARNQEAFIRDDVSIVVATVAFGMGINKPNVRFVVHYDLPKNIEHYYQEIGRAGRDGLPAHCLLLFGYGDIQKVKYFISQMSSEQEQLVATVHLNALLGYAETDVCRRKPLLNYFGEAYETEQCDACDNCTSEKKPLVDLTEAAQKFLSCVKRTGELFGAAHIIDVLRGSESQKILKFRHHLLSTHGIGTEHSKKQWTFLSRQFIQKGLLTQDLQYGSLKLTQQGVRVLRGHETVMGMLDGGPATATPVKRIDLDYDRDLFERLRQTRKALADELGVPPYVIFPDRTLMEMAYYCPQSSDGLLPLHGVGATKAHKFGADFLQVLAQYGHAERPHPNADQRPSTSSGTRRRKHTVIGEAFNAGQSVRSLQAEYGIQRSTLIRHLQKYAQEGHALRKEGLLEACTLSEDEQTRVFELFTHLGASQLSPIREALEGAVDYNELRLLQLHWL